VRILASRDRRLIDRSVGSLEERGVVERLLLDLLLDSTQDLFQSTPVLARVGQRSLLTVPATVPTEVEEQEPGVLRARTLANEDASVGQRDCH